jgi:hypothetical protein
VRLAVRGGRLAGIATVSAIAVAVAWPIAAQGRAGSPLFGLNDDAAAFTKHATAVSALGGRIARIPANWERAEPLPGVNDWSLIDSAVGAMRERGVRVLLVLGGVPSWARDLDCDPPPPTDCDVGAGHEGDYVEFARAVAARYPDAMIQSWNEPNNAAFGDLSPFRVAELTNELAEALPGRVIGPATAPGNSWAGYLSTAYARIAPSVPLAVNLFPRERRYARQLRAAWRHVRRIAAREDRPIWITERGFAASDYGARVQARASAWAYAHLARSRARTIIFHRLIDPAAGRSWQTTFGMMRVNGSRRPVFRRLARTVREGRRDGAR